MTLPAGTAARWVMVAKQDLEAAELLANAGAQPPRGNAAYHCQQAAEKLLTALIVASGRPSRRGAAGHDLDLLCDMIPADHPLRQEARTVAFPTPWATVYRYPADDPATEAALPGAQERRDVIGRLTAFLSRVEGAIPR